MEEIVREEDEGGVTGCCGKSHRALATSAPAPALPQVSQPLVWLWVSEAGSEASGPNRAVMSSGEWEMMLSAEVEVYPVLPFPQD